MRCRICNNELETIFTIRNMAQEVSMLYTTNTKKKGRDTELFLCEKCGMYQIPYGKISENYYLMMASQSTKLNKLQDEELCIIKKMHPSSKSILEVGCGDGNFLVHAKKYFERCVGIEPERVFSSIYDEKNLSVICDYMNKETCLKEKFDVVVARQVFEHLDNPVEVFQGMINACDEDGIIMLEIPNGEKSIRDNRYYDYFSDHLNYWTVETLVYLAKHNGMYVVSVQEAFQGDYLQLFCKKIKKKEYTFEEQISVDINRIENIVNRYEKTAIYGAGAKAQVLFLMGEEVLKGVECVYDSDIKKKDRYLANAEVPIIFPDNTIKNMDAIIIFAKSYADEIELLLKEEYGFQGEIFII